MQNPIEFWKIRTLPIDWVDGYSITNPLKLAKHSTSSPSNRLYLANPCCFREFNQLSNNNNRLFWGIHSIGKYKQSIDLSFLPFYLTTFNRLFCDNLKSNRLCYGKPEIQSIVLLIQSIDFLRNTISQSLANVTDQR